MIRLNNTPNEGSTVKVNLGFRDSAGQYYIPAKIQYTLLALNNDKESWSVVDNIYQKSLTPASSVVLTIPNVQTIEGTTLQRKVMIYWDAFVDNEYNSFVDEITFDIAPKPYIPNPPSPQPQPTIYVEIEDVALQVGTLSAAPVNPVFVLKTNLPVNIDNTVATIDTTPCTILKDSTGGILTVYPDTILDYVKSYTLTLSGLVSTISGYVMKEDFICNFVTESEDTPHAPIIEDKTVTEITENGVHNILPTDGYDATKEVEVTVDVNPPLQEKEVTENGVIEPDSEYYGLSKVTVNVPLEDIHYESIHTSGETVINPTGSAVAIKKVSVNVQATQDKEINITTNGDTTVVADDTQLLKSVLIHTAVPTYRLQTGKSVTINNNTTLTVNPDSGYDGFSNLQVTVNVTAANISLYAYTGTNTGLTFYSTKEITVSGLYNIIPKNEGGSFIDFMNYEVTVGDTFISFEYDGSAETLTRNTDADITR